MRRTHDSIPTDAKESSTSRRRYLAGLAVAGSVAIAGCGGGGGGGGDDGDDESNESTASDGMESDGGATTDGTSSGDGGSTDGGTTDDGCPAPPLSYAEQPLPPDSPEIVFDRPEGEYASTSDPDDSVQLRLGSDPVARLNLSIEHWDNQSVQDRIERIGNTDVTDEYDAASEATVLVSTDYDRPIPHETNVIIPVEEGTMDLLILHSTGYNWCPDALTAAHRRLVESTRLP